MNMSKTGKTIITTIYGIGTLIVFVLLIIILSGSHIVLFPNAMLPMELHELAQGWLMIGFIPMLIFSILLYKAHNISATKHKKRNAFLLYIPVAICLCSVIYWIYVWIIGILNTPVYMFV